MIMERFRYMVIGAHPDDCEKVGGICLKLIALGHSVKFLTVTNGCSGHHEFMGGSITARRREETERVSAMTGVEYEMLDNNDGYLVPGLAERGMIIAAIRKWLPDFIFTHRPCDYHPDHRAASALVQDSAYMVQVPNVCPTVPPLRRAPIIAYMPDSFRMPYPFSPTMAFGIDDVYEDKMRMYHQYKSQFYEWLPWVDGISGEVPEGDEERFEWLKHSEWAAPFRNRKPDEWDCILRERYGERAAEIKHAEAFELCEYGRAASTETLNAMFPF